MPRTLCLILTCCLCHPGLAEESPLWQTAYATRAVEQHRENVAQGCEFHEPRWHGNFAEHLSWAQRHSQAVASGELVLRDMGLESCSLAIYYAEQQLRLHELNQQYGCGFISGTWREDFKTLFSWALPRTRYIVARELQERAVQIENCVRYLRGENAPPG